MAKLTEFTTPTGAKGNLFSPSSWVSLIIGTVVFLLTFALGQHALQKIGNKIPVNTTIDPLVKQNMTATTARQAAAVTREVY